MAKKKNTYRSDLALIAYKNLGLSYRDLEQRSGVSRMTLHDTINGKKDATASSLRATFDALGIDPTYALNFQISKSEFRRAVLETAR